MRIAPFWSLGGLLVSASLALAQPMPAIAPPEVGPSPSPAAPTLPFGSMEEATPPAFQASADYLLWWVRSAPLHVPLATTDRFNDPLGSGGIANPSGGGLADPRTIVLLGDTNVDYGVRSGGRFSGGYLLGEGWSVEGSGFFLGRGSQTRLVTSDGTGNPFLFQPVNDTVRGPNSGTVLANPTQFAGGVAYTQSTDVWGAEVNLADSLVHTSSTRLDLIAGYRYFHLQEDLQVVAHYETLDGSALSFGQNFLTTPGDAIDTIDRFGTRNEFNGGQLGVRWAGSLGRLSGEAAVKVALGGVSERIRIAGSTLALPAAGGSSSLPGGFLAVASNSGTFNTDRFAVLPELNLSLGYRLTDHLRALVGYDFLYLSDVVRPGDQISLNINTTQAPSFVGFFPPTGAPAPLGPTFKHTDFWAQGVHFSLEFTY